MELLLHYADREVPLRRLDLQDAAAVFIAQMPAGQGGFTVALAGKNGLIFFPGPLEARHHSRIRIGRVSQRRSSSAEVLTTHGPHVMCGKGLSIRGSEEPRAEIEDICYHSL